jgi:autotransporter-associated beta strand protein
MRTPTHRLSQLLATLAIFLWINFTVSAATFAVTNDSSFASALVAVNPGDSIVVSNGNYIGEVVKRGGTAASPITIIAANQGQAVINSGIFTLTNVSYVTLQGLVFTNKGGGLTIDTQSRNVVLLLSGATNCRVTRCSFPVATNVASNTYFTFLNGNCISNRIDHCDYGPCIVSGCHYVWPCGNINISGITGPSDRMPWALGYGPYNPNMARYTWIDHNYFHDHTTPAANGGETIVLGAIGETGDYQDLYTTVEYNLFVGCSGDPEIISVKSSNNTLRYNTVRTSGGVFSLRSGNHSSIYGNFFLCAGTGGGVKLSERDHKVFNNYMENTDTGNYPIMLESGNLYNIAFAHAQVARAQIVHNTVVNPGRQVLFAHSGNLPVIDFIFANNIIAGSGTLYSEDVTSLNPVRSQNIIFGYTPSQSGFLVENPQLTGSSPQRLSSSSPAINNGNTNYYPYVTDDMDGQSRNIPRDIGADEYFSSASFIARAPLTTNEVGPNSVDMELSTSPASQTVSIGATNVSYTINVASDASFTNPVTLTVNGLLPGMSAGFNPPIVYGSGSVTLNVTNTSAVLGGNYSYILTATSSNLQSSTTVTLQVGRGASNLQWISTSSGAWDIQNSSNWFNISSNANDAFYNGDNVLFSDNSAAVLQTNVTIGAGVAVSPSVVTNNSSVNNFTISGAGKITGATKFVKTGTSTLTLNTTNDFTGGMLVAGGILKAGNPYALGGQSGFIILTNGGTLDVNGNNLGLDSVLVSGAGVSNNGAIINSGASVFPALAVIELAGNTTIGGSNRWDLRAANGNQTASLSTSANAYNLTKVGANFIGLASVTIDPSLANINIQAGTLDIEGTTTSLGNSGSTLTVSSNATLELFNTVWATNQVLNKVFVLNDGAIVLNGSGANILMGTMTLNGNDNFNIGGTSLTFSNKFSGSGNLIKTGSGTLVLNGTNIYTGNTIISNGTLNLTTSGVISKSPQITIASGATFSDSGIVTVGSGGIISSGGGTLSVGGVLIATNGIIGTLAAPIGNLSLNNSMLQFSVAAGNTNASVGTLSLGGSGNMINIAALPTNFPVQYLLIKYSSLSGSFNLTLGALPGGYVGFLSNNTANSSVDLIVNGPSTFSISATPPSQTAASGGATVNYTVTVSTNIGFSGSVALGVSGLPANTSFSFTPSSLSAAGSSTLSITTSNNTPVGAYPLTISGINGIATNSAAVTLIVGRFGGANLEWNSSSSTAWDVTNSYNWFNLGSSANDQFYNGDTVLFDDTAAVTGITIATGVAVSPSAITNISSDDNFTISGNGKIIGAASIVKDGTSTLTLSTTNNFTGGVSILNGILKVTCTNALGAAGGNVVVQSGGTFDLNGVTVTNQLFTVAGSGYTNGGALVNNGAQQTTAFHSVTLAGDTTFGGTGRWDIRSTGGAASLNTTPAGNAFSITKVGTNYVALVGVNPVDSALADIDIQQGTFAIQTSTTQVGDPSRTITIHGGATLDFFTLSTPLNKNVVIQDGGIVFNEKGPSYVSGPIVIQGNAIFNLAVGSSTTPTLNCSNVISGAGNLIVTNSGALVLGGTNTYTGNTLVTNGTLLLTNNGSISESAIINVASGAILDASGRSDGKLTLASGQILSGRGNLNGAVIVGSGATLAPGNSIGTLTFNNNLTLNGGSTTFMGLNKTLLTNAVAQVAGTLTYGGTLALTNLSGTLTNGDSFKLFNAAIYNGVFTNITPAIPAVNLAWNTNNLAGGILGIVSAPTSPPNFGNLVFNGNNFTFSGAGGVPGWTYYILATTNLGLPASQWPVIATNAFDANGNFNFTNNPDPNASQTFYLLRLQ